MWHADKQKGQSLPSGLPGLYPKRNRLQRIVWKWPSVLNCARGAQDWKSGGSVFIKREYSGSRSAEGACERRARLQTSSAIRMCESEATSGWRDPGGHWTALVQSKENTETGERNLGVLPQWLSVSESLLRSCLKGRFRELLLLCIWHQARKCALKVSLVTFLGEGTLFYSLRNIAPEWLMKPWERLLEEKSCGLRIAWWDPYQEGGGIKGTLGASSADDPCRRREQAIHTGTEKNYNQT